MIIITLIDIYEDVEIKNRNQRIIFLHLKQIYQNKFILNIRYIKYFIDINNFTLNQFTFKILE